MSPPVATVSCAERPPGEVHRLVQAGRGLGDGGVGPQRLDHLLAVEAPVRREREQLDEVGRRPPAPVRRVDRVPSTRTANPPSNVSSTAGAMPVSTTDPAAVLAGTGLRTTRDRGRRAGSRARRAPTRRRWRRPAPGPRYGALPREGAGDVGQAHGDVERRHQVLVG